MKFKNHRLMIVGIILFLIGVYFSLRTANSVFHASISTEAVSETTLGEGTSSSITTGTSTNTAAAVKATVSLSPEDQRKLDVLKEILASHNDNDPRIDTELANLSPTAKRALEGYYQEVPTEKRNQRGTIVFLIGQKISSKEDIDFLKSVLMEKLCLSLQDCSKPATPASGEEAHLEGINETTAAYPQLMAIRAYVTQYQELSANAGDNKVLLDQIVAALQEIARSPNPKSVADAERALQTLKR